MRLQHRKTPGRPRPGTVPALARPPRRPQRLGAATPTTRLTRTQQPRRRRPGEPATSAIAMPVHRTSEYLRLPSRAHRQALDAPRPLDDEFEEFVDRFEQVLDAILERF